MLEQISTPEVDVLIEYLEAKGQTKKRIISQHSEVDWAAMTPNKTGAYTATVVRKRIEELRRASDFPDDAIEPVLIEALDLLNEVKHAKKAIKDRTAKLHLDTKALVENLDDQTAKRLLHVKWVRDMLADINSVSEQTIDELIERVAHLATKYATTLSDIGNQSARAAAHLAEMMGRLTGPEREMEGIGALASLLGGQR